MAILMLSQNGTSQDHQYIMDSLDSASRFGISQNLSAIVAAAIELEGESVLELVESNYFSNPVVSHIECAQVCMNRESCCGFTFQEADRRCFLFEDSPPNFRP